MANAPDPQYVLDLAAKLVEAKEHVASLQKQWDALFALPPNSTLISRPLLEEIEDALEEMDTDGITARFLHYLESFKPRAFTVAEIAHGIEAEPIQIHRAIGRLLPKGKIKRAERGKYQAPDSEVADAA